MSKRKLKRQLRLGQVVMLGTAGAIGSEIFVLTGHAADVAGRAAVLALLVGGLLSYSVALNYCELATSYPVAGGAMSYVREAYGVGLLSYLVGSIDCFSSTFYAALSAVGFAYSFRLVIPGLPIVPVAIAIVLLFMVLNLLGVTKVGNAQIVLGVVLLGCFLIYILAGFTQPGGFSWNTYFAGNTPTADPGLWADAARLLQTIALVYVAYVGFEVIADDAEEVSAPERNIPRGILISLTLTTVIYVTVALLTLGVVTAHELAGSETALTDAVQRFLPGWGLPLMALAGIIATLTSINTAMLSATREAFSLGRDGVWPAAFSRLNASRGPWVAIVVIALLTALIAAIGLVDFLSYIASSGYLFVLFWASLAMIKLRRRYPELPRPFKVPLFPLTAYAAGATCILIIAFSELRALAFGAALLVTLSGLYFAVPLATRTVGSRWKSIQPEHDRILVAAANPVTAKSLVHVATIIAQASIDPYICVLTVDPSRPAEPIPDAAALATPARHRAANQPALARQSAAQARARNIALYVKTRHAANPADGILEEIAQHNNVYLVLTGWPGPLRPDEVAGNPVKLILQKARTNVAVLLNRGLLLQPLGRILVPVGGGPHSRLALRLSLALAESENAPVTLLRVLKGEAVSEEKAEDQSLWLAEFATEVLGDLPPSFTTRVRCAASVQEGVLSEACEQPYSLIVMGASEEWASRTRLFGSVDDWVADRSPCSVLLCRQHERAAISWVRRRIKGVEYDEAPA